MPSPLCPSCWPPNGYNLSCVITSLLLVTVCSAQLSSAQDGWMVCCSKAVMSLWPILTGTRSQEPLLLTSDTKPATCGLWTGVCTASWNEASSQRFLCERAWQLGNAQHTKKRQKESCRKRISCDILKKAKNNLFYSKFCEYLACIMCIKICIM